MASNINPANIDNTYPIAGKENSSQGFRDNFSSIKNNLTYAQNEITDLQNKALVTTALNGQTLNNDMAGGVIKRPQLQAWTNTFKDNGVVTGSISLDFTLGNFQKITTSGPVQINFTNWPQTAGTGATGYGVMRVWVILSAVTDTITLDPAKTTLGVNDVAGYNTGTGIINFDQTGNYLFEFSSINGGDNYLVTDITRSQTTLRGVNLYYNPTVNSTVMVGYGKTGLTTALPLERGQNMISTLGSYNSMSVGNLTVANITYRQTDTNEIAGYTVSAARGNLQTGTVQAVRSNDLLGYYNASAYTGNIANLTNGNTFQQVAGINFFATGSNVTYGLGGNIAFFTADDGGTNTNQLAQAVGIENDQSVRLYGNVTIAGTLNVVGQSTLAANITTVANLANVGDVTISSISGGQVLAYNEATRKWINSSGIVSNIANVGDVSLSTITGDDFLRYDSTQRKWINTAYTGATVRHTVTIIDGGSGSQNVFAIDGTRLKTNTGVLYGTTGLTLTRGGFYKFDISNATNEDAGLGFSTTPDTTAPVGISAYTTGVTRVGTAGTAGAYVTIQITDTTPSPLYLYGIKTGTPENTLYGAATPIYIVSAQTAEQSITGNLTVGDNTHASNVTVYGSANIANYLTAYSGIQNTPIGTVAPSLAVFSQANITTGNATTFTAKAIGNVTPGTGAFTTLSATSTSSLSGNLIYTSSYVPGNTGSAGTAGQIALTATHIYVCVSTNSWLRANLVAW
jgi:hypothetical protein